METYVLVAFGWIFELASETVADPLIVEFIWFVVVLPWSWDKRDLIFVDDPFLLIMHEAVSSSLLEALLEQSRLLVAVGRGVGVLILEGELVPKAEGCGTVAQGGDFVIVVWSLGDLSLGGEPVGFGEGVELLGPGVVERRAECLVMGG
jgi:hypothetical protein